MGNVGPFARLEDHYHVQKVKLGEGAFGTVWRGVDKKTDEMVAIKQLKTNGGAGRSRKDYEHEVSIMRQVNHENVLSLRGAFEERGSVWLVLDYMDGGDLGDKIKECPQKSVAAGWMAQVCSAIGAMHAAGIVHRDVKPDNFMISNGKTLKLADFGLALALKNPHEQLMAKCGTPAFMAPEQHALPNSNGYGKPADMWAAGIILYMLLHGGQHPFLSGGQMHMDSLMKGRLPKKASLTGCLLSDKVGGGKANDLQASLVNSVAERRLTAAQALRHPFLAPHARRISNSP